MLQARHNAGDLPRTALGKLLTNLRFGLPIRWTGTLHRYSQTPPRPDVMHRILLCADQSFVVPLAVALRSIAESQTDPEDLDATVLSLGISDRSCEMLAISAHPLSVTFIKIDSLLPVELPRIGRFSRATYGRLLGVDLLDDAVDRVIYLDADIVVRDCLQPLLHCDLGSHPVGGVQDPVAPHLSAALPCWRSVTHSPTTPYMNSGVMVMDCRSWRERRLGHEIVNFLLAHRRELRWADQDGINGVLAGDFHQLAPRWNQMLALRQSTHLGHVLYSEAELSIAAEDPAIIHYNGSLKPWHIGCNDPASHLWWDVLKRTEFRGFRARRATPSHRVVGRMVRDLVRGW